MATLCNNNQINYNNIWYYGTSKWDKMDDCEIVDGPLPNRAWGQDFIFIRQLVKSTWHLSCNGKIPSNYMTAYYRMQLPTDFWFYP